jgi:hypothetical protein
LALNASFTIAVAKIQAKYEVGKSAALLYALNRGLYEEGVLSEEEFVLFRQRYSRKLKDVIAEGRGDTHKSVLEKQKEQDETCKQNIIFKQVLDQWDIHTDINWRFSWIQKAKQHPDLEYAKLLIAKSK